MITTLTGFVNNFPANVIENGKKIFDDGLLHDLIVKDDIWSANVIKIEKSSEAVGKPAKKQLSNKGVKETTNKKIIIVQARICENKVTDVFCSCKPGVCVHIIALLFAVQKHLGIIPDAVDPAIQPAVKRYDVPDERLVKFVEWLKMGESVSPKEQELLTPLLATSFEEKRLRPVIGTRISGETYPVFYGAHDFMDEAEKNLKQGKYRSVIDTCQAVINYLCDFRNWYNSVYEGCERAVKLLGKLLRDQKVPMSFRQEVFTWSVACCATVKMNSAWEYLIKMLVAGITDIKQQELLNEFISVWPAHPDFGNIYKFVFKEAQQALRKKMNRL